jgi:hypothetical protein
MAEENTPSRKIGKDQMYGISLVGWLAAGIYLVHVII